MIGADRQPNIFQHNFDNQPNYTMRNWHTIPNDKNATHNHFEINCKIILKWWVQCVKQHNNRTLSGSFMKHSTTWKRVAKKKLKLWLFASPCKWRKEKQRARSRTQLLNNVGILFSAVSILRMLAQVTHVLFFHD